MKDLSEFVTKFAHSPKVSCRPRISRLSFVVLVVQSPKSLAKIMSLVIFAVA